MEKLVDETTENPIDDNKQEEETTGDNLGSDETTENPIDDNKRE
ncbi:MAG: 30S ribosomal protein S1, partial [Deltaproteobacteria bacterium]|nr:30S ribosomal protein S1 [Deltaproteobacteria bacterium]